MTTSMALLYLLSITLVVAGSRYLEEEEWMDSPGKNDALDMKKTEKFSKGFDPIPNVSSYKKGEKTKGNHVAAEFDKGDVVVEKNGRISEEFDPIPNATAYKEKGEEKKSSQKHTKRVERGFQSMLLQPSFMGQ